MKLLVPLNDRLRLLSVFESRAYKAKTLRRRRLRCSGTPFINQEILRDIDSTFVTCRHGRHGYDF